MPHFLFFSQSNIKKFPQQCNGICASVPPAIHCLSNTTRHFNGHAILWDVISSAISNCV